MDRQDVIKIALEIINIEGFNLYTDKDNDGDIVFKLSDRQGGNLGGIEDYEFYNLGDVLDSLDVYHIDYFYEDEGYKYNEKYIKFLEDDDVYDILIDTTPSKLLS